jgi:hypothetical protein
MPTTKKQRFDAVQLSEFEVVLEAFRVQFIAMYPDQVGVNFLLLLLATRLRTSGKFPNFCMLRHLPDKIRALGALPHQDTPAFEGAIKTSKDYLRKTNQHDKEFNILSRQVRPRDPFLQIFFDALFVISDAVCGRVRVRRRRRDRRDHGQLRRRVATCAA